MSLNLDPVLQARAQWRKAILIPLWLFQIAVLLGLMGIFAYRLAETFEDYNERDKHGDMPIVEVVWEATNVGFNLIALILNIVEIARMVTERLTPFVMLFTQTIKLTLAFAVLALDIVAYLERMDGHYSTIGLSLDCGLLAANIAALIYAARTYRRLLHYEDYHLTWNTAPGKAVRSPPGGTAPASWRGREGGSGGEAVELGMGGHPSSLSYSSQPYHGYSDYDQPRSLHHSPSTFKRQADRAISAGFGWGGGGNNSSMSNDDGGGAAGVRRSNTVVVASGTVPAHHAEVGELHHQRSWVTEVGTISAEEVEDGGSRGRGMSDGTIGDNNSGHYGGARGAVDGQGHHEPSYPGGAGQDGRNRDEEEEALLSAR
ncbi:hypothetical protein VTH82DRAFT_6391 [Thermothelomyces myriococcoides]